MARERKEREDRQKKEIKVPIDDTRAYSTGGSILGERIRGKSLLLGERPLCESDQERTRRGDEGFRKLRQPDLQSPSMSLIICHGSILVLAR